MLEKTECFLFKQQSYSGDAVLVTDYATDFIFRGKTFTSSHVLENIPTTGKYLLFKSICDNATIIIPPSFKSSQGPVLIKYYGNADYNGLTGLHSFNRNMLSQETPQSLLISNPTGTSIGSLFSTILVGESNHGVYPGGGDYTDNDLFVVPNGTNILMFIDNKSGATIDYLSIRINWYEY